MSERAPSDENPSSRGAEPSAPSSCFATSYAHFPLTYPLALQPYITPEQYQSTVSRLNACFVSRGQVFRRTLACLAIPLFAICVFVTFVERGRCGPGEASNLLTAGLVASLLGCILAACYLARSFHQAQVQLTHNLSLVLALENQRYSQMNIPVSFRMETEEVMASNAQVTNSNVSYTLAIDIHGQGTILSPLYRPGTGSAASPPVDHSSVPLISRLPYQPPTSPLISSSSSYVPPSADPMHHTQRRQLPHSNGQPSQLQQQQQQQQSIDDFPDFPVKHKRLDGDQ